MSGYYDNIKFERESLPLRTHDSVPLFGDLLMFQWLRLVFPNLPCLFSTFHLEYFGTFSIFLEKFSLRLETEYVGYQIFGVLRAPDEGLYQNAHMVHIINRIRF